jgi:RecA-family ATPase
MSDNYAGTFTEDYGETEQERVERERQEREQSNGAGGPLPPLPFIDMSAWDSVAPPARQWLILDHIPLRQVSLLSGAGGIGKSVLTLQLLAATALRREWVGELFPKPGAAIYLGAEDEQDEIHRRLAAILEHYDATFSELVAGGFRALAFAGKDAVLAEFDRNGRIKVTKLFRSLYAEAVKRQPSAIVVDTVSDVFLGDEIKRDQVRQFGSLMRRLAIDANAAVIIASHPSITGLKSGTGLSGSTQWHNTVRARAYFRRPKNDDNDNGDDDRQPDYGRRELEFMKNQYGRLAKCIPLQWWRGLWLPPSKIDESEQRAEAERKVEDLFLTLLRRFTVQGRNVSDKTGTSYAPAQFAKQAEAKTSKITNRMLAEAMERLFTAGRIKVATEGPPSHPRTRLVEALPPPLPPRPQTPSTELPPPSTGVCVPPPYNPPTRWNGQGAVEAPARPTGVCANAGPSDDRGRDVGTLAQLAPVLIAWRAVIGLGATRTLDQVIELAAERPDLNAALLAVAAMDDGVTISNVRLARWLRSLNEVAVDHLMLSGGGVDATGSPLWTLTADA